MSISEQIEKLKQDTQQIFEEIKQLNILVKETVASHHLAKNEQFKMISQNVQKNYEPNGISLPNNFDITAVFTHADVEKSLENMFKI